MTRRNFPSIRRMRSRDGLTIHPATVYSCGSRCRCGVSVLMDRAKRARIMRQRAPARGARPPTAAIIPSQIFLPKPWDHLSHPASLQGLLWDCCTHPHSLGHLEVVGVANPLLGPRRTTWRLAGACCHRDKERPSQAEPRRPHLSTSVASLIHSNNPLAICYVVIRHPRHGR